MIDANGWHILQAALSLRAYFCGGFGSLLLVLLYFSRPNIKYRRYQIGEKRYQYVLRNFEPIRLDKPLKFVLGPAKKLSRVAIWGGPAVPANPVQQDDGTVSFEIIGFPAEASIILQIWTNEVNWPELKVADDSKLKIRKLTVLSDFTKTDRLRNYAFRCFYGLMIASFTFASLVTHWGRSTFDPTVDPPIWIVLMLLTATSFLFVVPVGGKPTPISGFGNWEFDAAKSWESDTLQPDAAAKPAEGKADPGAKKTPD